MNWKLHNCFMLASCNLLFPIWISFSALRSLAFAAVMKDCKTIKARNCSRICIFMIREAKAMCPRDKISLIYWFSLLHQKLECQLKLFISIVRTHWRCAGDNYMWDGCLILIIAFGTRWAVLGSWTHNNRQALGSQNDFQRFFHMNKSTEPKRIDFNFTLSIVWDVVDVVFKGEKIGDDLEQEQ